MFTKHKKLILLVAGTLLLFGAIFFFQSTGAGTETLWRLSDGGTRLVPLIIVAALIDSINPCAFGILLLTIGFLLSLGRGRGQILKIGGVYVLGLLAVYILIGLGLLQALHLFNTPHFMAKLGAGVVIALGLLSIIGELFPSFPLKIRIPEKAQAAMARLMQKASLPATFLLGALVGLCEFPCTGGPYLMVVGLLHDASTYARGFAYLIFYNLVFILPLVLLLLIASNPVLTEKVQAWKQRETGHMRLWGGVAMIMLGILILFL